MISFLQLFQRTAQALTSRRDQESTRPVVEQSLISDVIWDWPKNEPIRVDIALKRFPELRGSPRALIDLAIEEFNDRCETGENLSATEFAGRFPGIQSQLLDSLVFEKGLRKWTGWFQKVLELRDDDINWPGVGDQVAGFELVEALGRGGFSRVFVAKELGFENRKVAVKICRQDTHESKLLATLTHSGIGAVHYVKSIPETGMTAICMPLTSRSTLDDVLKLAAESNRRPASASIVWDAVQLRNRTDLAKPVWVNQTFSRWVHGLMASLAEALAASHAQDIVHCDLKPTNVLVTPEGKPTLLDFNVAFRKDASSSPANVGGTLPYMAPEQIRAFTGEDFSTIGPQTDVYGLAATIYELLTGRLPFGSAPSADEGVQSLLTQRRTQPESIRRRNPDVSPEFDALILECLSYEEELRPQSAEVLIERLAAIDSPPAKATVTLARSSAIKLTAAAAGLFLAVTFLPLEDGQQATGSPRGLQTAEVPAEPTVDEKIEQLLTDGFDACESEDYKSAEKHFLQAMNTDPGHEGAVLAWIRTNFKLGNVSAVEREARNIYRDGSPVKSALHGLGYAGVENFELAIPAFEDAVAKGMASREVLSNLGFSYYRFGKYDEAIEVLERVRRMGGDTSIANVVLAQCYTMVWQRRVKGKLIHHFDDQLLENLVIESRDSPATSLLGSQLYALLANRYGRHDPVAREQWARKSLNLFSRGCDLGLAPTYWNAIKHVMPESLLATEAGQRFAEVPSDRRSRQHLSLFLMDPFVGTRFERWTGRKLNEDD